jgi:hypothetical protein
LSNVWLKWGSLPLSQLHIPCLVKGILDGERMFAFVQQLLRNVLALDMNQVILVHITITILDNIHKIFLNPILFAVKDV